MPFAGHASAADRAPPPGSTARLCRDAPVLTDKQRLRAEMRARRDALTPGGTIPVPAAFRERLSPGLIVAGYHPIGSEADPAALIDAARAAGCSIASPHVVDRATPLRFLADDGVHADGPFGLRQPRADRPELHPDIVLTPLLAFDRAGNRLGQGAGHYDRAFAALPGAWRVGIAFAGQEVDQLPADPWDVPLHAIATERGWIAP